MSAAVELSPLGSFELTVYCKYHTDENIPSLENF